METAIKAFPNALKLKGIKKAVAERQSQDTGHADLCMAMFHERRVVDVLKKLVAVKSEAAESWIKWANAEKSPGAVRELFLNMAELNVFWIQLHKKYIDQYDQYQRNFRHILDGEMAMDELRKQVLVHQNKLSKVSRQLLEAKTKPNSKNGKRIEALSVEYAEARSLKDEYDRNVATRSQHHESFKYGKVREAMKTLGSANHILHDGCLCITQCQQQLNELYTSTPFTKMVPDQIFWANQEAEGSLATVACRISGDTSDAVYMASTNDMIPTRTANGTTTKPLYPMLSTGSNKSSSSSGSDMLSMASRTSSTEAPDSQSTYCGIPDAPPEDWMLTFHSREGDSSTPSAPPYSDLQSLRAKEQRQHRPPLHSAWPAALTAQQHGKEFKPLPAEPPASDTPATPDLEEIKARLTPFFRQQTSPAATTAPSEDIYNDPGDYSDEFDDSDTEHSYGNQETRQKSTPDVATRSHDGQIDDKGHRMHSKYDELEDGNPVYEPVAHLARGASSQQEETHNAPPSEKANSNVYDNLLELVSEIRKRKTIKGGGPEAPKPEADALPPVPPRKPTNAKPPQRHRPRRDPKTT